MPSACCKGCCKCTWMYRHFCYEQGPTFENPCDCCYLTVPSAARVAAGLSSWVNTMKIIYSWMSLLSKAEQRFKLEHIYKPQYVVIIMLFVMNLFSALMYRGVMRFKSHLIFPWLVVTCINLLHEFCLILPYSVYFHKTGKLTHLLLLLHALASVFILTYCIWIAIVFLRHLRQDKFGPNALKLENENPDPHYHLREARYKNYFKPTTAKQELPVTYSKRNIHA